MQAPEYPKVAVASRVNVAIVTLQRDTHFDYL